MAFSYKRKFSTNKNNFLFFSILLSMLVLFWIYDDVTIKLISSPIKFSSNLYPFSQSNVSLPVNFMHDRKRAIKDVDAHLIHLDLEYKRLNIKSKYSADTKSVFPDAMRDMLTMRIEKGKCSETYGHDLVVIASVNIKADSFERRKTLRETWAGELKSHSKAKLYFNLGSSHDEQINKRVKIEDEMFGDIIQFNHYDAYNNQTIKLLGMLRWSALNCPLVRFVLKIDDDCVLNVKNLVQFCEETKDNSLYGMLFYKGEVLREKTNKYYVPYGDFPNSTWPDYEGSAIIIPGKKTLELYSVAVKKSMPTVFLDDCLAGILAQKINLPAKNIPNRGVAQFGTDSNIDNLDMCAYHQTIIFSNGIHTEELQQKLWNKVKLHQQIININCSSSYYDKMKLVFPTRGN